MHSFWSECSIWMNLCLIEYRRWCHRKESSLMFHKASIVQWPFSHWSFGTSHRERHFSPINTSSVTSMATRSPWVKFHPKSLDRASERWKSSSEFPLGTNQLIFSVVAGYIQIQWMKKSSSVHQRTPMMIQHIFRDMLFIGICRFITVILGLIAIKDTAVSLVATIKSSSPLFTVIITRVILREKTSKRPTSGFSEIGFDSFL